MSGNEKWALVTGASSGIGEEFSRQLAIQGYNLIITARREHLLKNIAAELINDSHIKVEFVKADLSEESGIGKIRDIILQRDNIEILVNNAGFATAGSFAAQPLAKPVSMVMVQVGAVTVLSHAVLQQMIKRKTGGIINVSSVAAFLKSGYNVTYYSSKSYINTFSSALAREVNREGIDVQALCPGFTYSGFHDTEEYAGKGRSGIPKWLWLSAEEVVKESLAKLGTGKIIVIPGFKYKFLKFLVTNPLTSGILNIFVSGRRRKLAQSK